MGDKESFQSTFSLNQFKEDSEILRAYRTRERLLHKDKYDNPINKLAEFGEIKRDNFLPFTGIKDKTDASRKL